MLISFAAGLASLWLLLSNGVTGSSNSTSTPTATSTAATTVRPAVTPSTSTAAAAPTTRGPLPGSVTCMDVEQAGSASALPAASLRALQPQQAASCIALLGKDPLGEEQARAVWDLLLQAFESADMVPDDTLRLLGWVAAGIPPDHLANLSLSEVDTVATLGKFHNLSLEQLTALAESVRFQWSAKEPEDLSHLDLAALNHILCGFNASEIARVHADAYKEAAGALSLLRCPGTPGAAEVPGALPGVDATLPQLRALAGLAESGDAFGDPGRWGPSTVGAVGCVLVGLSNTSVARIPSASLHGMLQALAARERPVVRRCLYGTPLIAQRLASSDEVQQSTSTASTSSSTSVTPPTSNNSSSNNNGSVLQGDALGRNDQLGQGAVLPVAVLAAAAVAMAN